MSDLKNISRNGKKRIRNLRKASRKGTSSSRSGLSYVRLENPRD